MSNIIFVLFNTTMEIIVKIEYLYYLVFLYCDLTYKRNQQKSPSANAKGLGMVRLPRQDEFRNFCMCDETEKIYHKLEEAIGVC